MRQRFSNNNKQLHYHHKESVTKSSHGAGGKTSFSNYYYLIVFVVAFVAYSNTLNAEFVYDDKWVFIVLLVMYTGHYPVIHTGHFCAKLFPRFFSVNNASKEYEYCLFLNYRKYLNYWKFELSKVSNYRWYFLWELLKGSMGVESLSYRRFELSGFHCVKNNFFV